MFMLSALAISAAAQATDVATPPLKILPDEIVRQSVTPDDYPIESLKRNEQGTVEFVVDVGTDGRVKSCTISKSSGSANLDAQTCRIMQARLRFRPAHDAQGIPLEDRFGGKVNWILSPF